MAVCERSRIAAITIARAYIEHPPDGSWQGYLKIDTFNPGGSPLTRDLFLLGSGTDREVPLNRPTNNYKDRVILRGRNYVEDKPLKFTDTSMGSERPDTLGYAETRFDVGFRVVIEIPEKYQPK